MDAELEQIVPLQRRVKKKAMSTLDTKEFERPLLRDDAAWKDLLLQLDQRLPLPSLSDSDWAKLGRSIEKDFKFSALSSDESLLWWHVESLLDQAIGFLDRALSQRREIEELRERLFVNRLVIEEFRRLDVIHAQEIAAGFYSLRHKESTSEHDAETTFASLANLAAQNVRQIVDGYYNDAEIIRQSGASQLAAWAAGFPPLQSSYEDWKGFHQLQWGQETPKSVPDQLYDTAVIQSYHNLFSTRLSVYADWLTRLASAEASNRRADGRQERETWEGKDSVFRKQRTQVARDLADLRVKAFTEPNGPLNFLERVRPLEARVESDLRDACARLFVASKALDSVFGLKAPDFDESVVSALVNASKLDAAVDWARFVSAALLSFFQRDQNHVAILPVHSKVSSSAWREFKSTGSLQVPVTPDDFPNQYHTRLRGIEVGVRGGLSCDMWKMRIDPPETSFFLHRSRRVDVVQRPRPQVRYERATTFLNQRPADVVGTLSMRNMSPYGLWTIECDAHSAFGHGRSKLEDVVLQLHVASNAK